MSGNCGKNIINREQCEKLEAFFLESGCDFERNSALSCFCTFKIGGPADFIVKPKNKEQLVLLLDFLETLRDVRHMILGNGSNVLFPDEGYRGVVVLTEGMCQIEVDASSGSLSAGCGFSLTAAAVFAYRNGLSGLEFAYGIPGSIGGAVYMNAGAFGSQISDVCESVNFYDSSDKTVKNVCASRLDFSYRHSRFSGTDDVILSALFRLWEKDGKDIKAKMDENMRRRTENHPLNLPNAGSVFKRCEGHFTSKLIEDAGLKGRSVGAAAVSEKHAGFIVNRGGASSHDVKKLIDIIKETVLNKFGVVIECEIRIIE